MSDEEYLIKLLKNIKKTLDDPSPIPVPYQPQIWHISSPQNASLYLGARETADNTPIFVSLPTSEETSHLIKWKFVFVLNFYGSFLTNDEAYHWHYQSSNASVVLEPNDPDAIFGTDHSNLFRVDGATAPHQIRPLNNPSLYVAYNPNLNLPYLAVWGGNFDNPYLNFTLESGSSRKP